MTSIEVIKSLKAEAESNPAANAIFHVWAVRQRARSVVTLEALLQTLREEKYDVKTPDVIGVLRKLETMGIGKLETYPSGRVKGLTGIKTNLKSIGVAAVGDTSHLSTFRPRNKFNALPAAPVKAQEAPKTAPSTPVSVPMSESVVITIHINGKAVTIPVPKDLTSSEIAVLIAKLQRKE